MRSFRNKGADYCSWQTLTPVQKQALTVIADKIARVLSGDPDYADNWHDIQGYAKLEEDRLPKPKQATDGGPNPNYKIGFCSHGVENWMNCAQCKAGYSDSKLAGAK
jgi:hypothetical protein